MLESAGRSSSYLSSLSSGFTTGSFGFSSFSSSNFTFVLRIFDELFSGTNPYEAISSAYSYLNHISNNKNVKFMLTTHYLKLCDLLKSNKKISFSVPTGNFGDIFAGFIAKKMGLAIDRLVVATNQNDILHRCLTSGVYKTDKVLPSISPSMDIQVSSNFERALFYAADCDGKKVSALMDELKNTGQFKVSESILEKLQECFVSGRVSEEETLSEIAYSYQKYSEILCPHSAVGVFVGRKQSDADVPMVTLATAHPAKFPKAVEKATSIYPKLPSRMADLFDLKERITIVENNLQSIESVVRERIQT